MAVDKSIEMQTCVQHQLARIYSILGCLFLEIPTAELFTSIDDEFMSAIAGVRGFCPEAGEEVTYLYKSMSQAIGDIRADYADLFAGVKKLPAPPWESCYLSGKRQVCTQITEDVRLAYIEACFCQEPSEAQPDDHIGLELQFLGVMSTLIAGALEAGDGSLADTTTAQRKDFITKHLSRWVPAFCVDLKHSAGTEFYRSLARLTTCLINYEMEGITKCPDQELQNCV